MSQKLTSIVGRTEILKEVGDDPYTRMSVSDSSVAYSSSRAIAWFTNTPWAPLVTLRGDAEDSLGLYAELRRLGRITVGSWLRTPLSTEAFNSLPGLRKRESWLFRWTSSPPPPYGKEDKVVPVESENHHEIARLLRSGNPDTVIRPDDPGIHRWYGIWEGDQLLACGADRSFGGVGYLAAITVSPGERRKGYGAALTAAMVRRLILAMGAVGLGVNIANLGAIALYERLGFKDSVGVTTFEVVD
ncbi:GNAT family N-acetyltransferase [Streptomyces muensis]|uniref:GNAT family N-acetyltransferase n=1 Tax=Streptomyces muensis TaxID=1077944 RepID=A0A9X1Q6Q4_STRM4|nr:GNAT family N-acetyltransferase [Streptomyces muensis]MCF1599521.1 GNAT family N-acetyltransferase [Streptomyces muensis]